MARRTLQIEIRYPAGWGGKRKGAGRKRKGPRKQVPHRTRPKLASRFPVHITVRMRDGLPRLRGFEAAKVLRRAFVHGCDNNGFRICEFSVQGNHIHLICEAKNARQLSRGIQGWKIRVTRGLNRHWDRKGSVFDDRFHQQIMKTPQQVRNGLCYVLQNARRHGQELPRCANGIDPYSSAWYFRGWRGYGWRKGLSPPPQDPAAIGDPVAAAATWLLSKGWRRCGLLTLTEVPSAGRARATRPMQRS